MKNYLLFLCSFLFFFTATAQKSLSDNFEYTVGEVYKDKDKYIPYYFTKDNSALVVIPYEKKFIIKKIDAKNLKPDSNNEYEDLPKNHIIENMIEMKNNYYLLYSSWSGRKTKHERLYYREIDFEKGQFAEKPVKLIDHKGKLAGELTYNKRSYNVLSTGSKFNFYRSEDSTKLLIRSRKKPKFKRDTKSTDTVNIKVFNPKLEKIWSREYTMPYTERKMETLSITVSSHGIVYELVKVFHDDSDHEKKDGKQNYHTELFVYTPESDEITRTKISLDNNYINNINLFENNQKNIVAAGFYSKGITTNKGLFSSKDKINTKNADGIYVCEFSKTGEVLNNNSYEIPLEILNHYKSKKDIKKNKKKKENAEFENLVLNDVLFHDDGSLILIGEQYYLVTSTSMKGRTQYSYYYRDILVTKIDASKKMTWMKKLPKRQVGSRPLRDMSYYSHYVNNKHYLFYLDNVKNLELPIDEVPAKHKSGKGGYLTAYIIDDNTGAVTKESIFDTRRAKEKLVLLEFSKKHIFELSKNELILKFDESGKKKVLVSLKIKD